MSLMSLHDLREAIKFLKSSWNVYIFIRMIWNDLFSELFWYSIYHTISYSIFKFLFDYFSCSTTFSMSNQNWCGLWIIAFTGVQHLKFYQKTEQINYTTHRYKLFSGYFLFFTPLRLMSKVEGIAWFCRNK